MPLKWLIIDVKHLQNAFLEDLDIVVNDPHFLSILPAHKTDEEEIPVKLCLIMCSRSKDDWESMTLQKNREDRCWLYLLISLRYTAIPFARVTMLLASGFSSGAGNSSVGPVASTLS